MSKQESKRRSTKEGETLHVAAVAVPPALVPLRGLAKNDGPTAVPNRNDVTDGTNTGTATATASVTTNSAAAVATIPATSRGLQKNSAPLKTITTNTERMIPTGSSDAVARHGLRRSSKPENQQGDNEAVASSNDQVIPSQNSMEPPQSSVGAFLMSPFTAAAAAAPNGGTHMTTHSTTLDDATTDRQGARMDSGTDAMMTIEAPQQPHNSNRGLVEALPVSDDLPVATAQDGKNQPRANDTRPMYMYLMVGLLCLLVATGIVVGITCGTGHCSQNVYIDGAATMAPTTIRDVVAAPNIRLELTRVLGEDYFRELEETEYGRDVALGDFMMETRQRAFDWIVNQDPRQLEYDADNLLQRFLLVLFYYQTTRHKPWKDCNPPTQTKEGTTCYWEFYDGTDSAGAKWLSNSHECQWNGVYCEFLQSNEGKVTQVSLRRLELNGPLPWEITKLTKLISLRLHNNSLTGPLPVNLFSQGSSSSLEYVGLSHNKFIGSIPSEWFTSLSQRNAVLRSLFLNSNMLTGTIPSGIGLLPLEDVWLGSNALTGTLPAELFNMTSLQQFSLSNNNDITGTLPTEVGRLTRIKILWLEATRISGTMPSEIGLLQQLEEFDVERSNMWGTIPEELYIGRMYLLKYLGFNDCNFSGTISSSIGLLRRVHTLELANNNFHGTIPMELQALTRLGQLELNGNELTGIFPVSICQNAFIASPKQWVLVADCLPNRETGVSAVICAKLNARANRTKIRKEIKYDTFMRSFLMTLLLALCPTRLSS